MYVPENLLLPFVLYAAFEWKVLRFVAQYKRGYYIKGITQAERRPDKDCVFVVNIRSFFDGDSAEGTISFLLAYAMRECALTFQSRGTKYERSALTGNT